MHVSTLFEGLWCMCAEGTLHGAGTSNVSIKYYRHTNCSQDANVPISNEKKKLHC